MRLVITLLSRCYIENLVLDHIHNLSNKTLHFIWSYVEPAICASSPPLHREQSPPTQQSRCRIFILFFFFLFLPFFDMFESANQNRKI